jgi:hypothetical protein
MRADGSELANQHELTADQHELTADQHELTSRDVQHLMRLAFHGGDMKGDDAYQWALDGDAQVPLCHASRHARSGVAVDDGEAAAAHQMVGMHA